MKKLLTLMVVAIAALVTTSSSYALNPMLQQMQDRMNHECPIKLEDGLVIERVYCTDTPTLEVKMTDASFADLTSDDITPEFIKNYRTSFLEKAYTKDFTVLCKVLNLDLTLAVANPKGQVLMRTTFIPSDY